MKRKYILLVILAISCLFLVIFFNFINNRRSLEIKIDDVIIKPWHTKISSLITAGYTIVQEESGDKTAVGINISCTKIVLTKSGRKIEACVLNGESSHAAIKNIEEGYIAKIIIQEENLDNVLYNGLSVIDYSKEDLKLQFNNPSITPISLEVYDKGCTSNFFYRAKKLYKLEVECTY